MLLAAALAAFAGPLIAEDASTLPKPTAYVNDLAGVIDAQSRAQLEALSADVADKAKATIVVVTVKTLGSDSIEEFATKLEDNWKVGPAGTDRGAILLISTGERKYRWEIGRGLEGILNDAKVGDIGRTMVPALHDGQYGAAAVEGEQQVANVIAADAGVTLNAAPSAPLTYGVQRHARRSGGFPWVGPLIFVLFILFGLTRRRGGRYGGVYIGPGYGGGGFGGGGFGGGSGGGGNFGGGFGGGSDGGGASGSF